MIIGITTKNKNNMNRKKNNVIVAASLIIISILIGAESLVTIKGNYFQQYVARQQRTVLLYASDTNEGNNENLKTSLKSSLSWSRSASTSKRGSKRERIKNVLAKARRRTSSAVSQPKEAATSISNNYDIAHLRQQQQTANGSSCNNNNSASISSVIAEAASIGGSGGDFYKAKNGTPEPSLSSMKNGKTSPASTFSPPVVPYPKPYPEEELYSLESNNNERNGQVIPATVPSEADAFKGDVSAAFSLPPEPLPFTLPKLTPQQHQDLLNGERVQHQNDMGREGSGFVVVDVKAPPEAIWQCLLDFESYPTLIDTVRDIKMYTSTHLNQDFYHERPVDVHNSCSKLKYGIPSVTRAAFTLSKFRLNIAAIHSYTPHPQGHHMIFTLDPACTNLVLRAAKGIWYTERNPDNKGEEYTRVWLLCEVKVSSMLPMWITYYAAKRAMPRATTWLKPTVEENHNSNINRSNRMNNDDRQ